MTTATPADTGDSLSWPVDFGRAYGDVVDRGLCLGGGGLYFVAWQVGYLKSVIGAGVDLGAADRVVGTSAGSVVSTVLTAGRIANLHAQLSAIGRFPALVRALAPAESLGPSQQRALDLFVSAGDARGETVREIGRAALAAITPDPSRMRGNVEVMLQTVRWPSEALHITMVDAYTAERCVVTASSGIRPSRAVAASSAVPGLFPPQPVGDRRCMDGGVSGTGLHLDLMSGAGRVLILALSDGGAVVEPRMTMSPGTIEREIEELRGSGGRVLVRTPGTVDPDSLMAADVVPDALAEGREQAERDLDELREFWA